MKKITINPNLTVMDNIAFISMILLPIAGAYLLISRSNKWHLITFKIHEYIFYIFLALYWSFYFFMGNTLFQSITISAIACLPISIFFIFLEESQSIKRIYTENKIPLLAVFLILTLSLAAFQMSISIATTFLIEIDSDPCSDLMKTGTLMSIALFFVLTLTAKKFVKNNLLFSGYFNIPNKGDNDYLYFSLSVFVFLLLLISPFFEKTLPNLILIIKCLIYTYFQ